MLLAVTPSREFMPAPRVPRVIIAIDRVWIGAPEDAGAMMRGISIRVCVIPPAIIGELVDEVPEPFPISTDLVPGPDGRPGFIAAALTVILSVAVDVSARPPGPVPASWISTGNVPGFEGVHCSKVTVRRWRGKRTPRFLVATVRFSIFSVPRTLLKLWLKGFVTVNARLMGCGPDGAGAAVMACDVECVPPP